MSDWASSAIEEIAERVAMGPFGSSIKVSTFVPDGVPVISGQHLHESRLTDSNFNFVSEEHASRLAKANVQRGDVILTHAGTIGQVAVIPVTSKYDRYVISQRQFYIRCDRSKMIPEFLTYYLRSPEGQHKVLANANQTGVPSIAQPVSYIRTVVVPVPSLAEQQAIAGVLGALDDKIESNRRQMSTLGSMVQLVFLSQASEANREALLSIATVQKGVSYRSIDLQESKTAMMTLKSIDRNGGYKADGLKPYVGAYKATQVIRPGEFVVAQTDLTQGAEVVGRVVLVPRQSKFETLIASLDLAIVRPIDPADHWYLYAALVQEDFREHCRSRTSGTTVLHLGADALPSYRVPWSDSRARMRVASEVESLVRLAESRGQEIDHLMALRDTLLPELLSGRVQVRDAEKFVEGAV